MVALLVWLELHYGEQTWKSIKLVFIQDRPGQNQLQELGADCSLFDFETLVPFLSVTCY